MSTKAELKLVAPWYRWERQAREEAVLPRRTRPSLQKFTDPGLVNRFMEDPQASYRFIGGEDFTGAVAGSEYEETPWSRSAVGGLPPASRPGWKVVKKLFRPTHKRHYLVVCELHCDEPGLPDARLEHVCEMGFVVRRWTPDEELEGRWPEGSAGEVAEAAGVAPAPAGGPAASGSGRKASDAPVGGGRTGGSGGVGESARHAESGVGKARAEAAGEIGRRLEAASPPGPLQGWQPDPEREGRGRWVGVGETPGKVREEIHPLHPLVPRGDRSEDPARGARLLFGVIPTGTSATDANGAPRFDARHLYRIRAFVRRHDDRCPRRRERGDCPGDLSWSRASEPYRVASHSDLAGQKNVVVTAEMPDLDQLSSHTGPAGGLRMVSPEGSSLPFQVDDTEPKNGGRGGFQICTFPIPLITIVARFVFSLFLPVVVFLFQLFFLLPLRICIPPALDLDSLKLGAGPGAPLLKDAVADARASGNFDGNVDIRNGLRDALNAATGSSWQGDGLGDRMVDDSSTNAEMWDAVQKLAGVPPGRARSGADAGGDGPTRSPVPDNLVLEDRVDERPRVDAPELIEAVRS